MRKLLSTFRLAVLATCLAQAQQNPDIKPFLQRLDHGKTTRYVAAFRDLNGDGTPEAIVHLVGNEWCGSGGCNTLILTREGDSWRVVTKVTITYPPIRVLAKTSHGWHSIGVWVQGGGIQPGYEAELDFDGKTYPRNPSVPPARRLEGKPEGETVVLSVRDAVPLYGAQTASVPQTSCDCALAATPIEKLICRDAELASMAAP
jgi:hypothetical protein